MFKCLPRHDSVTLQNYHDERWNMAMNGKICRWTAQKSRWNAWKNSLYFAICLFCIKENKQICHENVKEKKLRAVLSPWRKCFNFCDYYKGGNAKAIGNFCHSRRILLRHPDESQDRLVILERAKRTTGGQHLAFLYETCHFSGLVELSSFGEALSAHGHLQVGSLHYILQCRPERNAVGMESKDLASLWENVLLQE